MNVGNSVRKAILDFEAGEIESSMMHACNAVDGTAKKRYPSKGNKDRFTQLIRDHYDVLGPMAIPGIDLVQQRWPIANIKPTAPGGGVDTADLIYVVHRCTHGHGDELPQGFDLIPDVVNTPGGTHFEIDTTGSMTDGKVKLSDRVIWRLLAVAVFAQENILQRVPDGFCFFYGDKRARLEINQWWGRASDFVNLAATDPAKGMYVTFTHPVSPTGEQKPTEHFYVPFKPDESQTS